MWDCTELVPDLVWAVLEPTDTSKNTKCSSKRGEALHVTWGLSSLTVSLSWYTSIRPPEMGISPRKTACGYPCGVWLVTHVAGYCFQATRAVLSLCGMHLLISVQDRVTNSVQDRVTHSVQDRVTQCSLSNATTIVWGELTGPWNAFVNQCTVPGDPQCSLGNATTVVMGLWNGLMECIC